MLDFHVAVSSTRTVKPTGNKNWVRVKGSIERKHDIVINLSDTHDYHISAYRYVFKSNKSVAHSERHPKLTEAKTPPIKKSIAGNQRRRTKSSGSSSQTAESITANIEGPAA